MEIFEDFKVKDNKTSAGIKELLDKKLKVKAANEEGGSEQDQQIGQPAGFIFESTDPYPELVSVIPNRRDVRQLKNLASGRRSELTAVLTYLYQYFILYDDYPEIARALEQIAIVEMKHYKYLSRAIVAFGGNPNLTDGQGNVWTGRNISTVKDVRKILQLNIKYEELAIREYIRAAESTSNISLRNLYLRIAKDEALHLAVLRTLLDSL